jgi:hypothetical protein
MSRERLRELMKKHKESKNERIQKRNQDSDFERLTSVAPTPKPILTSTTEEPSNFKLALTQALTTPNVNRNPFTPLVMPDKLDKAVNGTPQVIPSTTTVMPTPKPQVVPSTSTVMPTPKPQVVPSTSTVMPTPKPQVVPSTSTVMPTPKPQVVPSTSTVMPTPKPQVVPASTTVLQTPKPQVVPASTTVLQTPKPQVVPASITVLQTPKPQVVPASITVIPTPKPQVVPASTTVMQTPKPQVVPVSSIIVPTPKPQVVPASSIIVPTPKPQVIPSTSTVLQTPKPQVVPSTSTVLQTPKPEINEDTNILEEILGKKSEAKSEAKSESKIEDTIKTTIEKMNIENKEDDTNAFKDMESKTDGKKEKVLNKNLWISLIKKSNCTALSSDVIDGCKDLCEEIIRELCEFLESEKEITVENVKMYIQSNLKNQLKDIPTDCVFPQNVFVKLATPIIETTGLTLRPECVYILQTYVEYVLIKMLNGAELVKDASKRKRVFAIDLLTCYQIYKM